MTKISIYSFYIIPIGLDDCSGVSGRAGQRRTTKIFPVGMQGVYGSREGIGMAFSVESEVP